MTILISACLLGANIKYNGGNNSLSKEFLKKLENHKIIPICPELFAGLSTPRVPIERKDSKIISKENEDLTKKLLYANKIIEEIIKKEKPDFAIMKEKSPSCGVKLNYDGSFSGVLINRRGISTELISNYIPVYSEEDILTLLELIE